MGEVLNDLGVKIETTDLSKFFSVSTTCKQEKPCLKIPGNEVVYYIEKNFYTEHGNRMKLSIDPNGSFVR